MGNRARVDFPKRASPLHRVGALVLRVPGVQTNGHAGRRRRRREQARDGLLLDAPARDLARERRERVQAAGLDERRPRVAEAFPDRRPRQEALALRVVIGVREVARPRAVSPVDRFGDAARVARHVERAGRRDLFVRARELVEREDPQKAPELAVLVAEAHEVRRRDAEARAGRLGRGLEVLVREADVDAGEVEDPEVEVLAGRELDRPHERVALVLELRADDALDHQVQVLSRFAGAANYIVRRVRDASADLAEAPRVRRRGARPPPEEALQGGRVGVFGLGLGPVGARLAVEPRERERVKAAGQHRPEERVVLEPVVSG
mmetsp:Transcript_6321/g.19951  ORF Transcript_6321/g.19951 Transcript_6321/m.19951 type:complete len:321 (-) Transcript_6321:356-1318(-)